MPDPTLYNARHQAERARWQQRLDDGELILCGRCGKPVPPDPRAWDLGHTRNRRAWSGPQHAGCNRATKAHMSADRKRTPRRHPSDP